MQATGHTRTHLGVMIASEGERAVITGDMAHHPCRIAHPDWPLGEDPETAAHTRRRPFAAWAGQKVLVIGTHFAAPTAGRTLCDGAKFVFAV